MNVPEKYHRLHVLAQSGRSQTAAIRLHCLMCMGWESHEVKRCTMTDCPLYAHRLAEVDYRVGNRRKSTRKTPDHPGFSGAESIESPEPRSEAAPTI